MTTATRKYLWVLELVALAAVLFNLVMVAYSFRGDWMWSAEDDVRQNLFQYARAQDPELFPNDLIAVHAEAFQPPGYSIVMSALSGWFDVIVAAKVMAVLLVIATTALLLRLSATFFGFRSAFFWLSLIFATACAYVWFLVMPGMPRSFSMPLSLLALLSFVTRGPALFAATVALAALFSPTVLVYLALLTPFKLLQDGSVAFRRRLHIAWKPAAVLLLPLFAGAALVYFDQQPVKAALGPLADYSEWASNPAFLPDGRWATERLRSLEDDLWLVRERAIPLPSDRERILVFIALVAAGLVSVIWAVLGKRFEDDRVWSALRAFTAFLAAALIGWGIATQLGLRLYLPDRQFIPLIASTLFATFALGSAAYTWLASLPQLQRPALRFAPLLGIAAFLVLAYPTAGYRGPDARPAMSIHLDAAQRELLTFLRNTVPKDAVIAGSPVVMDDVPLFARRSVFVGWEVTLPLYPQYYAEMMRRTEALIPAYFTDDLSDLEQFRRDTGVSYMVVTPADFRGQGRPWTNQFMRGAAYMQPFTATLQNQIAAKSADAPWWWERLNDDPAVVFRNTHYLVVDLRRLSASHGTSTTAG